MRRVASRDFWVASSRVRIRKVPNTEHTTPTTEITRGSRMAFHSRPSEA